MMLAPLWYSTSEMERGLMLILVIRPVYFSSWGDTDNVQSVLQTRQISTGIRLKMNEVLTLPDTPLPHSRGSQVRVS